jgi:hypothetical protein
MKAPGDFDQDMLVVLEIVQHCGEILSRLPLYVLREHIGTDDQGAWSTRARACVLAAEAFELAVAELSAEEARVAPPAPATYPDDALPSA